MTEADTQTDKQRDRVRDTDRKTETQTDKDYKDRHCKCKNLQLDEGSQL